MTRNIVLTAIVCLLVGLSVQADTISVKLTAPALGLGNDKINHGHSVDPDQPGFYTSSNVGEGSFLKIQTDGLAGLGTPEAPLFVTLTARTHMDTLSGLPAPHDYQAGIITITEEKSDLPDGRKEGLGVKAFEVNGATGLRVIDNDTGRAAIEGSKHVSGGTGPAAFNSGDANGAPHVDEDVTFTFNPDIDVNGRSIEVLLSDYESTDIIDLHIERASGANIDLSFMQTSNTDVFELLGDKLYKVKFSGIAGLGADDIVRSFTIAANDDVPCDPKGTAEHFFITGISAVPEPATLVLLAVGGLLAVARRRRGR